MTKQEFIEKRETFHARLKTLSESIEELEKLAGPEAGMVRLHKEVHEHLSMVDTLASVLVLDPNVYGEVVVLLDQGNAIFDELSALDELFKVDEEKLGFFEKRKVRKNLKAHLDQMQALMEDLGKKADTLTEKLKGENPNVYR